MCVVAARAVVLGLVLGGCSEQHGPLPADPPGDTLVVAVPSDVGSLVGALAQNATDVYVDDLLVFPLFEQRFDCRLEFLPALARSWSFSADGRTLSLSLRDDIRWSDGVPVTAGDVAFGFEFVADPAVGSPRAVYLEQLDPAARPRVVDATHLEFRFTERYDPTTMLGHVSSVPPLPHHVLRDANRAAFRHHWFNDTPVVEGPWRAERRPQEQAVVLVPNERWTGPASLRPRLDRVVFRTISSYRERLAALERGAVDLVAGVEVEDADRLARRFPHVALHRRSWRTMDFIGWNAVDLAAWDRAFQDLEPGRYPDPSTLAPHPLFGDPGVRQALSAAIDVDRIIEDLLTSPATGQAYARRAVGVVSPALCDLHHDGIQPLPHDPAVARAALESRGWRDTDGDGILDRKGRPFRFTLLTNEAQQRRARVALLVQAQLRQVGVAVEVESVAPEVYYERLQRRDFHAVLGGWAAGLFPDPSLTWQSGPDREYNFVGYANPAADALIEEGLAQWEPSRVRTTWQRLQEVVYADQPYTFLYWMDEIVAVDTRFQDVEVDIVSPWAQLHRWWVPPDQVKYEEGLPPGS